MEKTRLEVYIGILRCLSINGSKSQEELRQLMGTRMPPDVLNFLVDEGLIQKKRDSKYSVMILGNSILEYFGC
jgi:hypothetical protein